MTTRGFYEVASTEEGKAVQQDQSYRSCVLSLVIFLFLCIILIVIGLLVRKGNNYNEDEDSKFVKGYHGHFENHPSGTTSTTKSSHYSTDSSVSNKTDKIRTTLTTTTTVADVANSTDKSHIVDRFGDIETTVKTEASTSSTITSKIVTDKGEETSPIINESVTNVTERSTTAKWVTKDEETSTLPTITELVNGKGNVFTSSVTNNAETSTMPTTTTELVKNDIFTSSASTEWVDEETSTLPTITELVNGKGNVFTSSVTDDEETSTVPTTTTELVNGREDIFTSSVTRDEETSTSPTTTELVNGKGNVFASSVTDDEETSTVPTTTTTITELVNNKEDVFTFSAITESVTEDEETSTSPTITELIIDKEKIFTSSVTDNEETSAVPITTTELVNNDIFTSSVTKDEEATTIELATDKNEETTFETSTISTENITKVLFLTTDDTFTSTFSTTLSTISADTIAASTTGSEEETTAFSTTDNLQNETAYSTSSTEQSTTEATISGYGKSVCDTGKCKNMASQMLFYMNHEVDPCEDFYEYACGGFEANPRIGEVNSESAAYNRIMRQLREEIRNEKSSLFTTYYDSCIQYETLVLEEKIDAAREALDSVGKFYTVDTFDKNNVNITMLVARLLLHNSALLFDVSPELDENNSSLFTLKIGPTTYKSPFEVDGIQDDPCYASQFERDQETVDLEKLYKEYKSCKNNTKKFLSSIKEALSALGVFQELGNEYNISQYMDTTVINIDIEIVQKFFANFPSQDRIRKAYLMKEYSYVTSNELQTNWKIINWLQLVTLLTKYHITPSAYVQVYFYDALTKGLKNLEEFGSKNPMELNNALLGLYAQTLYQQLVLPKHVDPKDYCLRVATNLLTPEASNLYISTFSKNELLYMNNTIHRLFEELKTTLKLTIEKSEWTEGDRERLVAKIDNLKVVTPDISYFDLNDSVYGSMKGDKLTGNYFNNSIALMKRYRKRMYTQFGFNPADPEQIWTYYSTPFQSEGAVVYELNLVVIPFGAIDWSIKYDVPSFDYITLATIGNTIAHQIAHHFDANGIFYRSGSRHNNLIFDGNVANATFVNYINCQETTLYENPLTMTLPSTGQTVSYRISQLTLNERLSETVGLRLAYDTLDRLRSREEVHLPWLDLDSDQLFYLTYAQMHCTKLPLTSSYVSLHENEQLPSRIRIFVSASNKELVGTAWNCPAGSVLNPSYSCDVFPHLETEEIPENVPMS